MRRSMRAGAVALLPLVLTAAVAAAPGAMAAPATSATATATPATATPATATPATATPATAATAAGSGWVPAPSAPFDRAAGELCDFPIHGQPIVDEVRKRTLRSNPDGTPAAELYAGRLVVRVTDTANGRFYDADASGTALITYAADGSSTWYVVGPVLVGFRAGSGNLPRGLYVLDGVYRLAFSPSGEKTLIGRHASHDNVCTHIG
jgi:hypothetical protein